MRKKFEQQLSLGIVPIGEIELREKSRHQLVSLLKALQYVFVTEELNSKVFTILENHVLKNKKQTGRPGMSLWEIFVLSLVRLNLNADYDFLLDQANNHYELRGILGVNRSDYKIGKEYHEQTLRDNVSLLDEEVLRQLNDVIVEASHGVIKKKRKPRSWNCIQRWIVMWWKQTSIFPRISICYGTVDAKFWMSSAICGTVA